MVHLTAISLGIAYLIAASIITYALFNSFARHGRVSWVLIGIGFMLLALLLQVLAQEAPFIIIILTNIKWITAGAAPIIDLVVGFVKSHIYAMAIYMGFMAGVFQEVFKYLAVKGREPRSALYIGYGFALIDIAFTTINLNKPNCATYSTCIDKCTLSICRNNTYHKPSRPCNSAHRLIPISPRLLNGA